MPDCVGAQPGKVGRSGIARRSLGCFGSWWGGKGNAVLLDDRFLGRVRRQNVEELLNGRRGENNVVEWQPFDDVRRAVPYMPELSGHNSEPWGLAVAAGR
jgi:hypothetical protein